MGQDRQSGAAGNRFGHETAKHVATSIGAELVRKGSNEAKYQGARLVIKCANVATDSVGVTYQMLERLETVLGAFSRDDGQIDLMSLPAATFRKHMVPTRSKGASAGTVGL